VTKRRKALVFVLGLTVGIAVSAVFWTLSHGTGPLAVNRLRDTRAMVDSGREWAKPIGGEGLGNLHRVSPTLLRGEQPAPEGLQALETMRIRTVVNLRRYHDDADQVGSTSMGYEHIVFNTMRPQRQYVVRFLQIATDPERQPIFVHCKHGADRTGMMTAAYRVVVEGWTVDQAVAEWTQGGFGFHHSFHHLVRFFRELDFEQIKREIAPTTTRPAEQPDALQ